MVVGQYHLVAMTLNSLGVEPESDDSPCSGVPATQAAPPLLRLAAPSLDRMPMAELAGRKVLVVGAGTQPSPTPTPRGQRPGHRRLAGRRGATVACADIDTDAAKATADARRGRGRHRPRAHRRRGRRRCVPRPGRGGRPRRSDGLDGLVLQRGDRRRHGDAGHDPRAVGPRLRGQRPFALPARRRALTVHARGRLDRVHLVRRRAGGRAAASPPTTRRRPPSPDCAARSPSPAMTSGNSACSTWSTAGCFCMHLGDPAGALRRMAAALRPGGWLVRAELEVARYAPRELQRPIGSTGAVRPRWQPLCRCRRPLAPRRRVPGPGDRRRIHLWPDRLVGSAWS